MSKTSRRRRTVLLIIVPLIAGSAVIALLVSGMVKLPLRELPTPAADSAQTAVGDDGFEVTLGDIIVRGDADVAPQGTEVRVDVEHGFSLDGVFAEGTPVSAGIDVRLGDGLQPESEVVIEVPVEPIAAPEGEQHPGDLSAPFAVQEHGGQMMGVEFEYDSTSGIGIIRTHQLSRFGFIQIGIDALIESFTQAASALFTGSTPQPECYREDVVLQERQFILHPSEAAVAWPCFTDDAETTDDSIALSVAVNQTGVWLVSSDAALTRMPPSTSDIIAAALQSAVESLPGVGWDTAIAVPDVTTNAKLASVPGTVELSFSAPHTVIWSVLSVALIISPSKLLDLIGDAQCLIDIAIGTADQSALVKATLECIVGLLGNAGFVFSVLAVGSSALAANLMGIVREAAGLTSVTYSLTSSSLPTRVKEYNPFGSDGEIRADATVDDFDSGLLLPADSYPSPASKGPNTYSLGGSVHGASACWPYENGDPAVTQVVCWSGEPGSNDLSIRAVDGPLQPTAATADPVPLSLELADGSTWRLDTGGAGGGRTDGRRGMYLCLENCPASSAGAEPMILSDGSFPSGIDDSTETWQAFVGETVYPIADLPEPQRVDVVEAWYVR